MNLLAIFIGVLSILFIWVLWVAFTLADENKQLREDIERERKRR